MRIVSFYALAAIALGASPNSAAETVNVDFDAVNTNGGLLPADPTKPDDPVTLYLRENGIEVIDQKPVTRSLYVAISATNEGTSFIAPSHPNVFTQFGANGPISYTLRFKNPLASFSFTRARLKAGPNGVIHPAWTVVATDASGQSVANNGEPTIESYETVPARKFTLAGKKTITAVMVSADNKSVAAFSSVVLDDFVLTRAPPY